MTKKFFVCLIALCAIQACSSNKIDKGLKSPCVAAPAGAEGPAVVPCGPRRPVNRNVG